MPYNYIRKLIELSKPNNYDCCPIRHDGEKGSSNMNYETFCDTIVKSVEARVPDGVTVSRKQVSKNNGIMLEALMLTSSESNISPTIYMNSFWERYLSGVDIGELANDVVKCYGEKQVTESFDVEAFTNFENVKDRICYKVINYNKNEELLKKVPHYRYLDLAVVFYCLVEEMSNATILIHKSHANLWNVSEEDLLAAAAVNSPRLLKYKFSNIFNYLSSFGFPGIQEESENDLIPMYVLSNKSGIYGASTILYKNVLKDIGEKLNNDFYVFPSSIHEVIVMPNIPGCDAEYFSEMVKQINANEVKEEEILSDSVYFYNREKGDLVRL